MSFVPSDQFLHFPSPSCSKFVVRVFTVSQTIFHSCNIYVSFSIWSTPLSTSLYVLIDWQLPEVLKDGESVHCVPRSGANPRADVNLMQGENRLLERVSRQRGGFLLWVSVICTYRFFCFRMF